MIAAVSGHQDLGDKKIEKWLRGTLLSVLVDREVTCGVTSLAAGADQLFASCLAELSIPFDVIIPSKNYETTFATASDRKAYDLLLSLARQVTLLDNPQPSEDAFFAAGKAVVDSAQLLVAIWDGHPARGKGGTADIVQYAKQSHVPILQLNPLQRTLETL